MISTNIYGICSILKLNSLWETVCLLDNPQASLWAFIEATLEIKETAILKPVKNNYLHGSV